MASGELEQQDRGDYNISSRDATVGGGVLRIVGEWQDEAKCFGVDPDLFFPERGASTKEAKAVCRGCPVRADCLEFALSGGEKFGVWGGLSERERRRLRRQRAQASRPANPSS